MGTDSVSAIDPSASFVAAIRARLPEIDVQSGVAEQLPPIPDASFDVALGQLVVHFAADHRSLTAVAGGETRAGTVPA